MARSRDRMIAPWGRLPACRTSRQARCLPHGALLVLLGWSLALRASWADEPPKPADTRDALRQLGRLRAGLAFRAREEQRQSLKAGHLYLQAAQAFHRAGDDEFRKALVAGVVASQPLRATWFHTEGVLAVAFRPGDRQVLTCSRDGTVHLWDVATGREVRSFRVKADRKPDGASFSGDRSRMLVWGSSGVQLWDADSGKLIYKWESESPKGAAFLHGDRRVLVWGSDAPVRLWEIASRKEVWKLDKGTIGADGPVFSRDGARLLTTDRAGVYLWEVTSGKLLRTFEAAEEEGGFHWGIFSPDGKRILAVGGAYAVAGLFDVASGKRLATFVHDRSNRSQTILDGAEFSPDGTRLLTWGNDRKVRLWDVGASAAAGRGRLLYTFSAGYFVSARFHRNGAQVLTIGRPVSLWDTKTGESVARFGGAGAVTFTRDGSRLLLYNGWQGMELWDVRAEKLLRAFETPGHPYAIRLSEDESLLLIDTGGDGRGAVQLWDLSQRDGARSIDEEPLAMARSFRHGRPVLTAALDRDEKRLLTCDAGGEAHLWDVAKGKELQSFTHGDGVRGAAFDPDESRVVTWGEGGAKLWEVKSGKLLRTLKHPAGVRGVAFGPDGKHLLTWDADYTARWWDLARAEPLYKFEHQRDLFGAKLDRKGTRALTWGLDGTAKVWDLGTGRLLHSLGHDGTVFGGTFGPNEGRIWMWSGDGFREWDAATGKVLRHLRPSDGVGTAELSRDGKRFLLRTAGGLVQYWDVATQKELATFHHVFNVYGFYESVSAGAFNPDQTRVLTWAGDGSVHLWDLGSGLKLKTFRHKGAVGGAAFTRDGRQVLSWGADGTARLWPASFPRPWSPDDQLLELEVRSGLRVDEHGKLQELSLEEWQERQKRLESVVRKKYEH